MNEQQAYSEEHRRIFGGLHSHGGGEGSAPGSTLAYTRQYRAFLEQFIVERGIGSVLDAGCGDWRFSCAIDWKGARYVGLDIVPELVERNRARFPGIDFVVGDARRLDNQGDFDLLIVKDVLQHWSLANVLAFLRQPSFGKFKHVLLTNCDSSQAHNPDISDGDWRPLNLLAAEFGLEARAVFEFGSKRVVHRGARLLAREVLDRFEWWIINLDRRADRLAHATTQLSRIGVKRAHRFQAFDGRRLQLQSQRPDWVRKGAVGCYLSHLALLKQAQARRAPCIVVEDDLVFVEDFELELARFLAAVPEDWDVILLSAGEHARPPQLLGPHHARLIATWGTTLVILRLTAIDRLLEEADNLDRPIDDFYIRMMSTLKFYAPVRQVVTQDWSLGSNVGEAG